MVEEAPVPSGVGHRTVRSVPEETQRRQRPLDRLCAGHERAFDPDGITGERQAHASDAGWNAAGGRVVGNQPIGRVGFLPEILESVPLQSLKLFIAVCEEPDPAPCASAHS